MKNRALLLLIDALIVNIGIFFSLLLRFDFVVPTQFVQTFLKFSIIFTIVYLLAFKYFRLYNRLWQYTSISDLLTIVGSVTIGTAINVSLSYFLMDAGRFLLPRSVFILSWIINIFLLGGVRILLRLYKDNVFNYTINKGGKPIIIVGAGDAGVVVAKELKRHFNGQVNLVGFIDDNPSKQQLQLMGLPVLGNRFEIPTIVNKLEIKEVIIAIPSANSKAIREIVAICAETTAQVKILPGLQDLIEGKVTINQIREVQLEDLLGREPVRVDLEIISQYLNKQVILVTGAGGSIGSELCRQIIKYSPSKLMLLDVCENNVYDIELELRKKSLENNVELIPLVKDVRDKKAIDQLFNIYKPQVVFHAAAHKHVPLMEANPEEAIKNNVMGTYNVAQAADANGSKKFVLISTDKAVNPTSIMGASKRVAEMFIQHIDKTSKTNFVAVRFGNVLGSRGSVVPLFKKQITEGGPVTVTHPNMVRYFMTIPEAVQLVIQAGAMAKGGEILVLDMGDPVKIMDLAKSLIKLSGFEPGKDIDIKITGIRPGEKLFEELLTAEEGTNTTSHKRIFVARPNGLNYKLLEETINNINSGQVPQSYEDSINILQELLPCFRITEQEVACNSSKQA